MNDSATYLKLTKNVSADLPNTSLDAQENIIPPHLVSLKLFTSQAYSPNLFFR